MTNLSSKGVDIEASNTGLTVVNDLSYEDWSEYMRQILERRQEALDHVERISMWMIGDLYAYGEDKFGEDEAAQVANEYSAETIRNARWVARNIPPEEREPSLSFGHHQVVAKLESDKRREALDYARSNELTRYELKKHLRKSPKGEGSGKTAGGPAYDPELAAQKKAERQQEPLGQKEAGVVPKDEIGKCPFCGEQASIEQFRRQ